MKVNKYLSILTKLLGNSIKNGKKANSIRLIFFIFKFFKASSLHNKNSIKDFLNKSFENAFPVIGVFRRFQKRRIYYHPTILKFEQELKLGMHWFFTSIKHRNEKKLYLRLTHEILDCYNNTGSTITKKQNYYDLIIKNRQYLNLLKYH
jgi:ribosomal protein S7